MNVCKQHCKNIPKLLNVYLGVYLAISERSFYRTANAIFGEVRYNASEKVNV